MAPAAKFYFGNVPQPIDPRDKWFNFVPAVAMPSKFMLPAMSRVPNLSQDALGACGSNTCAECILANQAQQGLEIATPDRLFIYYNTRWYMGTTGSDSGVDNRSQMKALANYGFPKEKTYNIHEFTKKPSVQAYAEAEANKITGYGAVILSLAQMKSALFSGDAQGGDGFIFGFDVFPQIQSEEASSTGILRVPSLSETPIGGHDVTVFGWDDDLAGGGFWFRNHWKNSKTDWWGSRQYPGCGFIPYAYATSARWCRDLWIISRVPGVIPAPPTPPPDPAPLPPGPTPTVRKVEVMGTNIKVKIDGVPVE